MRDNVLHENEKKQQTLMVYIEREQNLITILKIKAPYITVPTNVIQLFKRREKSR